MEAIITEIQYRIANKVPEVLYLAEDCGQLGYDSPNFPEEWPCVLIDITSVQWQNLGSNGQLGLAEISLKIAQQVPTGEELDSESFYTLTQLLFKALHGYTGSSHYSALMRTSEKHVQRDDSVKLHEMVFTTQIKDVSACIQPMLTPSPSISFDMGLVSNGDD